MSTPEGMLSEPVLTPADRTFFQENGYVLARSVVPQENLDAVIDDIFAYLRMKKEDPSTWYDPQRRSSLAHIHQTPSLWNNRQHPRLHRAFADIYGTEKLWVSMDRACMKPPMSATHPEYDDRGFIHWDMDTSKPPETWRFFVQGVLCLTDTDETMGGFQCVPRFHGETLKAWVRTQPADRNPRHPDLSTLPPGYAVTPIPAKAGDLVIWDSTLLHGNGCNQGRLPRLCQYVTMYPPANGFEGRDERIACWRERRAPSYWEKDIPEALKGREQEMFDAPAELTPLGRKLLGLDLWE